METKPRLRTIRRSFAAPALFAIFIASHWAQAGELLPYYPAAQQVPNTPKKVAQPARPVVSEQVYSRFAEQVRKLDQGDRATLAASFKEQYAAAQGKQDTARANHYSRLLTILHDTPGDGQVNALKAIVALALLVIPSFTWSAPADPDQILGEYGFDNATQERDFPTDAVPDPSATARDESADLLTYRLLQQRNATTYAWILAVTAVIAHLATLIFLRNVRGSGAYLVSVTGLIYVIFGTILLVVIASTEAQLTAAMGILGAVAGYVFGKSKREPIQGTSNNPAASGT